MDRTPTNGDEQGPPLLSAALAYHRRGFSIIPIEPGEKEPIEPAERIPTGNQADAMEAIPVQASR